MCRRTAQQETVTEKAKDRLPHENPRDLGLWEAPVHAIVDF